MTEREEHSKAEAEQVPDTILDLITQFQLAHDHLDQLDDKMEQEEEDKYKVEMFCACGMIPWNYQHRDSLYSFCSP